MSYLDDSTRLNDITIPGTHNSHALAGTILALQGSNLSDQIANKAVDIFGGIGSFFTGHGLAGAGLMQDIGEKTGACQDRSIAWQLTAGIRYIDLRVGEGWTMRHGRVGLPGTLFTVLAVIQDFLRGNPSETVLLQVKWDHESFLTGERKPDPPNFARDLAGILANIFGEYLDVAREVPTLSQARGKLVLANDRGNNFKGRGLAKQASSNLDKIWKEKGIKGVLSAPESAFFDTPRQYALEENAKFLQELDGLVKQDVKINLGILEMDFPVSCGLCLPPVEPLSESSILIWGLILLNFP